MLLNGDFTPVQVRGVPVNDAQVARISADGSDVTFVNAPEGGTGLGVGVRIAESGDVLLAWADYERIALAGYSSELASTWSFRVDAPAFTDTGGLAFVVDSGPSGETALVVDGVLSRIDRTGSELWAVAVADGTERVDGVRVMGSGDVLVLVTSKISPRTYRRRYRASDGAPQGTIEVAPPSIVLRDGSFYTVGQAGDRFEIARATRFDETGTEAWHVDFGTVELTSATVSTTGELLLVATDRDTLHVIAPGGEVTSRMAYCGGTLIAADDSGYTTQELDGDVLGIARYAW